MNKTIFSYILFLLSLMWFVLWVWCIAFHSRPWLSNFGVAAFVITGLLLGIIYFFSFYQWYVVICDEPKAWKRRLSAAAMTLTVVFVSHWIIKGVLWIAQWMGNTYGIAFWLFVGFILSGFVLYSKDRLFYKVKELFS
jgi:hypothetical protein